MCNDDQCTHGRREVIVRVAPESHVLGEVFRLHQLADVVEVRADATKRRIDADRFRGSFGKIRDDQTVVIWNRFSRIGSAPPTRVAVTIPLPMASALCTPSMAQSLAVG